MSDQIGALRIEVEARLAKFESDMGRAARIAEKEMEKMRRQVSAQLSKVNEQIDGFTSKMASALKGMFAGLSIAGFVQFQRQIINVADDINNLSAKFGISTQTLSIWRLAAEKSGTSLDGIAKGTKTLSKDLNDTDIKLKSMGISLRDTTGKVKPMEKLMEEIAVKVSSYADGTEKAALMTALFGKEGVELIPFMNDLGANLEETKAKAERFGVIVGPGFAAMAAQFNSNLRDAQAITEGFGMGIASVVLPALNELIEAQAGQVAASGGVVTSGEEVGEWLKRFAIGIVLAKNTVDVLIDGLKFLGQTAVTIFELASKQVGAFAEYFTKANAAITDVTRNPITRIQELRDAQKTLWASLKQNADSALTEIGSHADDFGKKLTNNLGDVGDAYEHLAPMTAKARAEMEKAAEAAKKNDQAHKPLAPHLETLADATKRQSEAQRKYNELLEESRRLDKLYFDEQMKNEDAAIKLRQATDEYAASVAKQNRELEDELRLAGLSGAAREEAERQIRAHDIALREYIESQKTSTRMSLEDMAARERVIKAKLDDIEATKKLAAVTEEWANVSKRSADEAYDAFKGLLDGSIQSFEEFGQALMRSGRTYLDGLIDMFRNTVLKPNGGGVQQFSQNLNQQSMYGEGGTGSTAAGWGNAIGMAYGGWQNAKNGGSAWSTIGSFTAAGAQIGGVYGAIIGAVVGILVALFVKHKPPDVRLGGMAANVRNPEDTFKTALGQVRIGTRATDQTPIREAVQKFDQAIHDMIGSVRGGEAQLLKITASLNTWAVDLKGDANNVENLLGQRFDRILSTFDADVQNFVNGADKLEDKVQRLGDAFQAQSVFADIGLDINFGQFLKIVDDLQKIGETTGQTMQRVIGATKLFGDVLDFMGIEVNKAGDEFVRFAAEIAESAGGLERAGKLWDGFLNRFYSPEEIGKKAVEYARETATKEIADIGLESIPSMAEFRRLFEESLPSLSAADIVQWLEAGNAIADLNDAIGRIGETATQTADEIAAAQNEQRQAAEDYASLVADLNLELASMAGNWKPSALAASLAQVRAEEAQRVTELTRLAAASRRGWAAEHDLGTVHQIAAAKAAQAIAQLRAAAQSLISQLYGKKLLGSSSSTSEAMGALGGVDSAIADTFQAWEDALKNIRKAIDDILLNTQLTTLTPQQQLAEAQRQFDEAIAAANGGDLEAAQKVPELLRTLLEKGRGFWASGDQYDVLFRAALAAAQSIQNHGTAGTNGGIEGVVGAAVTESEAAAEEVRQQRLLMAVELAGYLRDLGEALGQNVLTLAADMGVKLNEFVADLGVDLTHLSAQTATQLAAVANMLGVELSDLTSELGISLGSLRDANSYLNDSLEAAINSQPPDIRDRLAPLLKAVENATTDADANAAIAALEAEVKKVGGATAVALSPYLDNVDPPSMEDQIAALQHIDDAAATYLPSIDAWLSQIAASVAAQPSTRASYAMGSAGIPYDQVATVHAGEKIIDAKTSAMLDDYGIRVTSSGGDPDQGKVSREHLQESRALRKEVKAGNDLMRGLIAVLDKNISRNK